MLRQRAGRWASALVHSRVRVSGLKQRPTLHASISIGSFCNISFHSQPVFTAFSSADASTSGGGTASAAGAASTSLLSQPLAPADLSPDDIDEPDASRKEAVHGLHEQSSGGVNGAEVPMQGLDLAISAELAAPMLFSSVELDALAADLKSFLAQMNPAALVAATTAGTEAIPPISPTPPSKSSSSSQARPFLASWSVKEVCSWYLQVEEQLHLSPPAEHGSSKPAPPSFLSLLQRHSIDGARLLCFTSEPKLIPVVPPPLLARILYLRGLDTYSHMFQPVADAEDPTHSADPNMRHLQAILHSTVKIFCTSTAPDFARPWQQQDQVESSSSGFVISGRRILGNAHGATSATSIRVRKHGDATKYKATVKVIAHEADLVILEVDNEKFVSTNESTEENADSR